MRAYRAALLDIDGTLVDSNDAHAHAWREAFLHFGHDVTLAHVRQAIGMGGDNLMPSVIGMEKESEAGREIAAYRKSLFTRMLPDLAPFRCTRELVERLRADGFAILVTTSAPKEEMQALLRIARVADLIDHAVAGDDVHRSKPAPDVVTAAIERAGVSPRLCRLLGDTPYDLSAASAARVPMIGVRSGGFGDEALVGVAAIYDDVADLLARYERSPFGDAAFR